jgi:hypothetical protein
MNDKDFIGPRALNDYTANRVNNSQPKKWVEPKKVAMCIGCNSAMEPIDLKKKKKLTDK